MEKKNHGTASHVDGSYVELQAAVLRALPRDIDRDVALELVRNGERLTAKLRGALTPSVRSELPIGHPSREIYEISYEVSDLVKEGNYTAERGLIPRRFNKKIVLLNEYALGFDFESSVSTEDVLDVFHRFGFGRPTYEDALRFGVQYPEVQSRACGIAFLHEPIEGNVTILDGSLGDMCQMPCRVIVSIPANSKNIAGLYAAIVP